MDLTVGLFHRNHIRDALPLYDRKAGELVSIELFPATRSCILEAFPGVDRQFTQVEGDLVRGGAERSMDFFKVCCLFKVKE